MTETTFSAPGGASFVLKGGHAATAPLVDEKTIDARPPEFSDEALALRFADENEHHLRYVDEWSKWFQWNHAVWAEDKTRGACDLARAVCRKASAEASSGGKQIASAKTVAATLSLARADRRLAARSGQWDANPWLLNTPAGVVDLQRGEALECTDSERAGFYSTKITAVSPGGKCNRFLSFLDEITGGDRSLAEFIQRMFGYSICGSTMEHAMFFLYGTGANGKSVLLNTISGILGDYHRTAPIETFTASHTDRHPTELASLQGRRLVTATETEEGRRWAEAKIKALTGGDKIAARFMRADFFEFVPVFKLVIAGNHKPGLRSVDEAIRRRFHLVPFAVTIPEEDRDPQLGDKLRSEWPGILQWLIDGCIDWQERGLAPPEAVTSATRAYLEAEDAFGAWLDESCELDVGAWEGTSALFASWRKWAERAGEHTSTQKRLFQNLETRGFSPERKSAARGFRGIRIRIEPSEETASEDRDD